jgi:uncharacterized protein (DUF58 family)
MMGPDTSAVETTLRELVGLNHVADRGSLRNFKVRSIMSGSYLSRVRGRGMEFDEVRLYMPGDDVRSLDWRVTARTGKVHTKLYREERERPIFLSVDYRSTMFFATRGVFKSVMAAKLAALIAWGGNHHADRVGGQVFTDHETLEFKPRRGKQGLLHLLKHLADLSSRLRLEQGLGERVPTSVGGVEETFGRALERLSRHGHPGNLIFILSDFRGLTAGTEWLLVRLARHCDVVPVLIYDRLERSLPKGGLYRFSNGAERMTVDLSDSGYHRQYREKFEERRTRLKRLGTKQRIKILECCTHEEPLDVLARLAGRKAL